ncbi:hypothetical protein GBAR_LOCUS6875, partial [Geodia barretti]
CVSVCYSTYHLSNVCSSQKRYHLPNGRRSKDDATVEVSIAKPLSPQPKEESNSPISPPNPTQHPPENLGSDKLPEATLLSKPVQKREPLKQLPINLKPQIHSSSPSPQKKHSPVNKTPESHNLTSGLPSPVTNPQPRPLRKAKCPHCSKEYAFRSGLTKHLKKDHSDKTSSTSSGNIKCNQCNSSHLTIMHLVNHLQPSHGTAIRIETLNFRNFEEFLAWKEE